MELISKDALEAKLMLCMDMNRTDWSYNKMIMANKMLEILDQEPIIEERKHGHWEDIDLDTSVCSVCKKPQEYETKYCPECGAKMENNGDDDDE